MTNAQGQVLDVDTTLLADAWLAMVLDRAPVTLPPNVQRFLLSSRLRRSDGEMLLALRDAVRKQELERRAQAAENPPAARRNARARPQ